jgi:hypothetical protein
VSNINDHRSTRKKIMVLSKGLGFEIEITSNEFFRLDTVSHAYNPNYVVGRDQEDLCSRQVLEKS